jgi:hypothetical protein
MLVLLVILCALYHGYVNTASLSTPLVHDHEISEVLPRYSGKYARTDTLFSATINCLYILHMFVILE